MWLQELSHQGIRRVTTSAGGESRALFGRACNLWQTMLCSPEHVAVALHAAALKKMPVSCDLKKWRDLHPETCPGSLVLFKLGIAFSLCFSLDRPRFSFFVVAAGHCFKADAERRCQQDLACEHRAASDTGHHT